jgi:P-type conjugative transfer protein TrbJ
MGQTGRSEGTGPTGRAGRSEGTGLMERTGRTGRIGWVERTGRTERTGRVGRRRRALGAWALATALAVLAALGAPAPAGAIIPVTDYAHIVVNQYWHYVHYVHYVQFALQIYQEYQALANQLRQIVNQLAALKKLANPNWREVYDLLANLDWIMRQGQALAYSYHDIDAQFQKVFPGWVEVQNWPVQRQTQTVRTLDTMRTALDTTAEQFRHDIADQLFLERVKSQMDGIHGHQEALELQATIQMYTAQELGVIKQSLAAGNNMQAVYYGHEINREAQAEATFEAGITRTLVSNEQAAAPGYGALPSWWPLY